jgi:DNA polymerase-3 subunit alpha
MSNFVEVVEIEELDYTEDVYDITVEDNHNFYANGMLVHNCIGGCIGGPLAYEVFKHLQQVEFDNLHPKLLDDSNLMSKVQAGIGNAFNALSDSVGIENSFLELQFNKLPAQHIVNRALIKFADDNGLQNNLVVTCDSHYSRPEHWREREIYKKLGWLNYREYDPSSLPNSKEDLKCELYPKNAHQVWETYKSTSSEFNFYNDGIVCDAIERTHDIAHQMIGDVSADRQMKLPSYVVPEGKNDYDALVESCISGLIKLGLSEKEEYVERLKYELSVIKDKDFSRYFLTMKSIIEIARDKMFVGPGRGSGAGSLVNYVLRITDVDPIEYGLLFERFLAIDRSDAPDIDTDVADRDELIKLLRNNFGSKNIVPISNYNTFKLKSLIKDVSRFYGVEFDEVNKALSSLDRDVKSGRRSDDDSEDNFDIQPSEAVKYSKSLRTYLEKYPQVIEPIEVLFKQNKALGRHAGGVIISENILERMPLIMAKGELQTPWVEGMNYKHLEEFGWIKFDLLGLETLRIIERTIEQILMKDGIKKPTFDQISEWYDKNISPSVINFDDQNVYESVYHAGKFAGIFQCSQRGAQALFKRAKPKSVIDIATLTSIYRPGPLSAKVDKLYIKQKNNPESVNYGHPLIKQVLEETYGCLAGDTVITTEEGEITIQEIVDNQMIGLKLPSYNEVSGELEMDEIVAAVPTGVQFVHQIELEDGSILELTDDHRVYTSRGWVEAGQLTEDDEILGLE